MTSKLKIKIARRPDPDALLATRQIRPSRYLLRKVFGRSRPRHKMAILLPGDDADSVEVKACEPPKSEDSLTDLAEAVGVVKGGEAK
ncbi:hypothetical protein [Varibaculum cambriense]|uniref:hypothetical protein n=1 Tax=Varibaculum cambriense TaxID=184870 RepID=UPI00288BF987|nr:hypothetical protein [Varibaculum cambriense]